jgi:flagellar basal-body rod protein FlgF
MAQDVLYMRYGDTILNSGYYAACAGLKAQTQALDLVANNLANLSSSGYLGQQPTFHSLLAGARTVANNPLNRAINDFDVLGNTRLDFSVGNLQQTGNPLDLAVEGNGFFAIKTQAEVLYTRNGNFQISASGMLITAKGDPVLGDDGVIILPTGQVAIGSDGTISVDGAVAGKLRLVEFSADSSPVPVGDSYYSVPPKQVLRATSADVRQGMLESSNVNPVAAMVDLITVQRHFDMLQRALSLYFSEFDRIAVEDLPRV